MTKGEVKMEESKYVLIECSHCGIQLNRDREMSLEIDHELILCEDCLKELVYKSTGNSIDDIIGRYSKDYRLGE